jgi:hypothetical protein
MKINHDLQTRSGSPVKSLCQLVVCARQVGISFTRDDTPVTDGDANMVETSSYTLLANIPLHLWTITYQPFD